MKNALVINDFDQTTHEQIVQQMFNKFLREHDGTFTAAHLKAYFSKDELSIILAKMLNQQFVSKNLTVENAQFEEL